MKFRTAIHGLLATTLLFGQSGGTVAQAVDPRPSPLQVSDNHFLLRGKPFRIVSGELEYTRIPREYWRDRLRKAHAMGLNTITVYVFWNAHEPRPGAYDFTGQNDVAEFLREAQQEGLYVILRPGPYVCAEWDLGGYPAWLLKDHAMILRSMQPQFLQAASRWMMRLGRELAPLQADRGGPILAVQVENEYGSFGDDQAYLKQMHEMVLQAGFNGSLLYTADGADVMAKGSLPGLFAGIDFGTGDADRSIKLAKTFRANTPTYVAEYWDGWFDHWGEKHQVTDALKQEAEVAAMLRQGASVNLYMVHGGTTFGGMNGANSDHDGYQPDVSSYDYDAPVTLNETLPLWDVLPAAIARETPPSMEDVDQAYGYILYRRQVSGSGTARLAFTDLHSYARVYVDGRLAGVVDRRLGQKFLDISINGTQRLDILVENSGRINFKPVLRGERAGIIGDVLLAGARLTGWAVYPMPFAPPPAAGYHVASCTGPCFSRGTFTLPTAGDTYLNTQRLGKGVVWVNGHLLGRFWSIGPAGTLYLPGVWLHKGRNQITVLDLDGGKAAVVEGQAEAVYFDPAPQTSAATK